MKTFIISTVQHPHPRIQVCPLSLAGDERQKNSCRQGEQHSFCEWKEMSILQAGVASAAEVTSDKWLKFAYPCVYH